MVPAWLDLRLKVVNPARELTLLLEKSGRTREWLVKTTGYSATTVKQYLNGSKSSRPFYEKARKVLQEDLASGAEKGKPPMQWDLLFETEDEFNLVDRASRVAKAETVLEFCRSVILQRAEELLAKKAADYRQLRGQRFKVADEKESK